MNASLKIDEFHDIDQYMEYANPMLDLISTQLQPGLLSIKNYLLELDSVSINYFVTNLNSMDRYSTQPGYTQFVLTSDTNGHTKWCGLDVPINSIGIVHAHREHNSLVSANWDPIEIAIKNEVIFEEFLLSEQLFMQTQQPEKAIFSHEPLRIMSLRNNLLSYFQNPVMLNELIKNDSARRALNNWILDELRMIFSSIEDYQNLHTTSRISPSRRYKTFIKASALIEEDLASIHSVNQICELIGTTPRTLQLSFKELSGVSPLQYITARKLHAARQEIFLNKEMKSISHIAQDYGFLHMGRFSSQYKIMFSELPHETRKRRTILNKLRC